MDRGAIEEQLRVWVDHTSRSMYMVGAHLYALRAITPHGEWLGALQRVGIAPRAAQRFMQAAVKCVGRDGQARERVLQLGRSKLLELVALDDDQLDELDKTGSIAQMQLELDEIDRMSVSELKERLRKREQAVAAKDKLIEAKDKKINALDEQLHRPFQPEPGDVARNAEEAALIKQMHDRLVELNKALAELRAIATKAADGSMSDGVVHAVNNDLSWLAQRVAEVLNAAGVSEVDFAEAIQPTWVAQAKARMAASKKA